MKGDIKMNLNNQKLILVTGATGLQGGAVANEALKQGFKVRILVRDEKSTKAQALIQKGAEAVVGNFDDIESLNNAMRDVDGVFSVPISGIDTIETDRERKQANAVIQSALNNGVKQFVHTSVAATSRYTEFPEWGTGYWFEKYWTDKWDIEEAVRNAGFQKWTILKPAQIMNNFTDHVEFMYPDLKHGEITSVTYADTRIDHVAVEDIATFATTAFANPDEFNEQNIELAGDSVSFNEVARIFKEVLGKDIKVTTMSMEQSIAQGNPQIVARSQQWDNVAGYKVDIDLLKQYNIKLTSFKEFVEKHKDQFK